MWSCLVFVLAVVGCACAAPREEENVYPSVVALRDGSGSRVVTFEALGRKFHLNLKPSPSIFSDGFVHITADSENKMSREAVDVSEIQSKLFQDVDSGAAVHLDDSGLHPIITGMLADNVRIAPKPYSSRSATDKIAHSVFMIDIPMSGAEKSTDFLVPPVNFTSSVVMESLERQSETMEVELLMTLDKKITDTLSRYNIDAVHYASIFMNGVNCKFSLETNPRVVVKLSLLVSNRYPSWQPYIENNKHGENKVKGNPMLDDYRNFMNDWQNRDGNLKYDLAYLLTGLDMYSDDPNNSGLAGLAWVSGTCGSYKYGTGEDTPTSYGGVFTATHEFGHSLGCPHDGDGKPGAYGPGHPGSDSCPWQDGYIMSYIDGGLRRHRFSRCCLEAMNWLWRQSSASCLKTSEHPNVRKPSRQFPGHDINMQTYCENLYRDQYSSVSAHELRDQSKPENKCKLMCCPKGENFCYINDKLDGHPCGNNLQCENRYCVGGSGR